MASPYVCADCGRAIQVGRHGSGWRHSAGDHFGHRVRKVRREDHEAPASPETTRPAPPAPEEPAAGQVDGDPGRRPWMP